MPQKIDSLLPAPSGKTSAVAIIGSGGKTSLMFSLARAALRRNLTVITTTTTRIYPPHPRQSPRVTLASQLPPTSSLADFLREKLKTSPHLTLGKSLIPESGKIKGLPPEDIDDLIKSQAADLILVEADGARNMPLKAPAPHEPALPALTDLCLAVLGLDGLLLPISKGVFRYETAAEICGQNPDIPPSPECLARLALDKRGLLRLCPPAMQTAVICNKAENPAALIAARLICKKAKEAYPGHKTIFYASSIRNNWIINLTEPELL